MTTSEVEAYLAQHHPGKPWVVADGLGIGLPCIDGIMLYCRIDGPTPIAEVAKQVIRLSGGLAHA